MLWYSFIWYSFIFLFGILVFSFLLFFFPLFSEKFFLFTSGIDTARYRIQQLVTLWDMFRGYSLVQFLITSRKTTHLRLVLLLLFSLLKNYYYFFPAGTQTYLNTGIVSTDFISSIAAVHFHFIVSGA